MKAKDLRERVGEPSGLPNVAEYQQVMAGQVSARLQELRTQEAQAFAARCAREEKARDGLIRTQRQARAAHEEGHSARWGAEVIERAGRFRQGLMGLWDRVTGRSRRLEKTCQAEALVSLRRDRGEKDALIFAHLEERRAMQERMAQLTESHLASREALRHDIDAFSSAGHEKRRAMLEQFRERASQPGEQRGSDGEAAASDRLQALRRLREDSPTAPDVEREI